MRLRILLCVSALLLAATGVAAHANKGKGKKAAAKPSMEEMMKRWQEVAAPGAGHKVLEQAVGEWDVTMRLWMEPGKPPTESKGTSVTKWILGGRFVQEESEGEMMGMHFSGAGMTGYDNFKKMYVFSWADNMGTMLVTAQGTLGRDGKTITYMCREDDPMTGQRDKPVKYVTRMLGPDKHVLEAWDMVGTAHEFKVMEIIYTRKGSGSGL
jgi:Protein of unknown function (DUF1579)